MLGVMTTPTADRLLTIAEFEALPEREDGSTLELDEGRLVVVTGGGVEHGLVGDNIRDALRRFTRERGLGRVMGDVTFRLDRERGIERVPDIAFLAAARIPTGEALARAFDDAPDLAVEVTSPNDRDAVLARKIRQYLEAGTRRVWVARPAERQITVHRPGGSAQTYGEQETLTSAEAGFAVEGLALRVGEVFE